MKIVMLVLTGLLGSSIHFVDSLLISQYFPTEFTSSLSSSGHYSERERRKRNGIRPIPSIPNPVKVPSEAHPCQAEIHPQKL